VNADGLDLGLMKGQVGGIRGRTPVVTNISVATAFSKRFVISAGSASGAKWMGVPRTSLVPVLYSRLKFLRI